jgi:hypothetical protein
LPLARRIYAAAAVAKFVDVYESVQKVYGSLVPQLIDEREASRESVRELLWDLREEFRHIDYHIHDAELTDL